MPPGAPKAMVAEAQRHSCERITEDFDRPRDGARDVRSPFRRKGCERRGGSAAEVLEERAQRPGIAGRRRGGEGVNRVALGPRGQVKGVERPEVEGRMANRVGDGQRELIGLDSPGGDAAHPIVRAGRRDVRDAPAVFLVPVEAAPRLSRPAQERASREDADQEEDNDCSHDKPRKNTGYTPTPFYAERREGPRSSREAKVSFQI